MNLNPKKRKIEIVSFDDNINATVLSVSISSIATTFENDIESSSGYNHKVIERTRKRWRPFSAIWHRDLRGQPIE